MTNSEILNRIMKFCADAEKCTHDVISKLEKWETEPTAIPVILKKLRDENFLDDSRYAKTYTAEKAGTDRWGKIKIENKLRQKNINESFIQTALKEIDDKKYTAGLHELLRNKYREVKSGVVEADTKRVLMFALSRGFEEELINDWMDNLSS